MAATLTEAAFVRQKVAYTFVGENRALWELTKEAHIRLTKINSGGEDVVTLRHH